MLAAMQLPPSPHARPAKRPDDGRIVRGRKSRSKIHEAARALFREQGFDKTTLREIAARAGMGASSIYRHIRSKEELLVDELGELQQRAWSRLRSGPARALAARERLRRFLDAEHAMLVRAPDLTTIALRATTHPEARVARRALALQDQTIGLVAEILQSARSRGELRRDADVLVAARTLTHAVHGARLAWANGLLDAEGCRTAVDAAVAILFDGIGARGAEPKGDDGARDPA
jgi:AcrR family transcriptional regulator